MKNRKGFTIVELVIVIAVIAILAAVLIPTFTTVTANARASAAQQVAKTAQEAILSNTEGTMPDNSLYLVNNDSDGEAEYAYVIKDRKLEAVKLDSIKSDSAYPVAKTVEDAKEYIVFVTADYFDAEKIAKVKTTVEGMVKETLKKVLGDGTLAVSTTIAADTTYAVWTYTQEEVVTANVKVYYNGDVSGDCVAFIANN